MKRQIRRNVFETNSSSVHSITFSNSGLEPSKLKTNTNGEIIAELGEFSGREHVYTDQNSKLSYVITYLCNNHEFDITETYNSSDFKKVQKVICTYADAKAIKIKGKNGCFENQDYNESVVNVYDEEELINFVFNSNIWLRTWHD